MDFRDLAFQRIARVGGPPPNPAVPFRPVCNSPCARQPDSGSGLIRHHAAQQTGLGTGLSRRRNSGGLLSLSHRGTLHSLLFTYSFTALTPLLTPNGPPRSFSLTPHPGDRSPMGHAGADSIGRTAQQGTRRPPPGRQPWAQRHHEHHHEDRRAVDSHSAGLARVPGLAQAVARPASVGLSGTRARQPRRNRPTPIAP